MNQLPTNHLSLLELNNLIKETLERSLEPSYWIIAEISELKLNQKGHCYIELIEKSDDILVAKMRATIWSYSYRNISLWFESITGKSLAPGMKILANVVVQYHELYGMSLNIRDIDPNYTLGESARRRQEIINRLIADGVFDMNKGLSLPIIPQRIAVISSPTAAGWEDFLNQLFNNGSLYRFEVSLFKATMQGDEASNSIISALYEIHNRLDDFDMVAIVRGGGAKIDLDCFDSYELAAHVAQFPLPVLTGIGHERDETVVDLVAHTKLKTPTAVAEFIVSGLRAYEERIYGLADIIISHVRDTVKEKKLGLQYLEKRLAQNSEYILENNQRNLEQIKKRIDVAASHQLKCQKQALDNIQNNLLSKSKHKLSKERLTLKYIEKNLTLLNPENVLARGYSITYINGKPVRRVNEIKANDELITKSSNFELISTIKEVIKKNEK